MLRIQTAFLGNDPQEEIFTSTFKHPNFRKCLLQHGVDMSPNVLNPDVILHTWASYQGVEETRPHILMTCDDGGIVASFRNIAANPASVGIVKGSMYKWSDVQAVNSQCWYHGEILRQAFEIPSPQPEPMPIPNQNKFALYCGLVNSGRTDPLAEVGFDPNQHRPIKVFSSLNHFYHGSQEFEQHRTLARDSILEWAKQDSSTVVVGTSYEVTRAFRHTDYCNMMKVSRVIVSPWGYGEFCHRDYEAILAGCVLVKPDTSFSDTWPELEAGKHYVPCRPDFSDLHAAIKSALSPEWYNSDRRVALRNHVLQAWNPTITAARFANIVKGFA